MSNNNESSIPANALSDESWYEIAALTDYVTQYGSGASLTDIKLSDLYNYLRNPYANIKQIHKASKYLTNKHGIIKEVLRALKSLPTLDYSLSWSDLDDDKKIKKYEKKVHEFLSDISLKEMVRDGLYEIGEMGTIITCLRNKKYVQFLDLEDVVVNKHRNGKWIVEYDLKSIDTYKEYQDKLRVIESLPKEVTVEKYNLYKNKGDDYRYVELKNSNVLSIDSHRNFPYGLPLTLGAWSSILQKEIINRVERSVADRLIKQIVVLSVGTLDKEGLKPPQRKVIESYFKEVSNLLQKKEGLGRRKSNDDSGTGTIALPHFMKLDTLEVNTEMFKKELYEKINNDIYQNLGVSASLIWGGGSNFNSAQINNQKFFRYVFSILEKFEYLINDYIKQILPNSISCKFSFSKTTIFDKDKHTEQLKELYLQTGVSKYWLEAITGLPYQEVLNQVEYEKKVLKTDKILSPPSNAYTRSDNNQGAGRPSDDNSDNPNTNKSKTNGSNNVPTAE